MPSPPSPLYGSRILVTGGTGSIGSALVRALLDRPIEQIRVLGRDECRQVEFRDRLPPDPRVEWWIGDVRDGDRMREAVEGMDTIFHAAAMKHIGVCDEHPGEAFRTNVLGTDRVLSAGLADALKRFVLISTDKAVEPRGALGASKRTAERMLEQRQRSTDDAVLITARLGNVVGSRGSVLPRILDRLRRSLPIEIVPPGVTRFLMTIEDAAHHVLTAAESGSAGDRLIPRMSAVEVSELADRFLLRCAPLLGLDPARIVRTRRSLGRGEKEHERLISEDEAGRLRIEGNRFRISAGTPGGGGRAIPAECRSEDAPRLDGTGIDALLDQSGLPGELHGVIGWWPA